MKKIWLNKVNNFKAATKFDIDYYLKMSSPERLDILQFLREISFKLKGRARHVGRTRLRRSIEIVQLD